MKKTRLNPSKTLPILCAMSSALILPQTTQAYEQGDWILRAGVANVNPDSSSGLIHLGGTGLAGTSVDVEYDTQLGITLTYMLSEKIGIELLASTPFKHKISEQGVGVDKVGSVKQLPPTLSAQYYLMPANSAFQPYVGVGINYTIFFDEDVASEFEAGLGESKMKLDDSVGVSFQLGADYALNDKWSLNAAVWNIDIDTEATIDTAVGQVTVDVDINPWVYMFGAAYHF